jgi:hypothetical protein
MNRMHVSPFDALLKNVTIPVTMPILAAKDKGDGWVQEFQCCEHPISIGQQR